MHSSQREEDTQQTKQEMHERAVGKKKNVNKTTKENSLQVH